MVFADGYAIDSNERDSRAYLSTLRGNYRLRTSTWPNGTKPGHAAAVEPAEPRADDGRRAGYEQR